MFIFLRYLYKMCKCLKIKYSFVVKILIMFCMFYQFIDHTINYLNYDIVIDWQQKPNDLITPSVTVC